MNVYAVLLHFAGDMVSSAIVLAEGLLLHFLPYHGWMDYVDPAVGIVIVLIIAWSAFPLVKHCSYILLQSTGDLAMADIRSRILAISGVINVHDLHVWMLVDGVSIGTVHVAVEEGTDFAFVKERVREVFHAHDVHSPTIQPEVVPMHFEGANYCTENCVQDCSEDWCCRKVKESAEETGHH